MQRATQTTRQSNNRHHNQDGPCTARTVVSVVTATGKRPAPIPNPEAKPDSADGTATANNSGPGPTALHTHTQNHHPQTTVRSTASARHAACCWGSLRLRASVQVGSSQVFKDSGGTDGSPGVKEGLWRIRTVGTGRTTATQVGVAATVSVTASAHAALSQRRTVAFAVAIMRDGTTTPTAPADIPIG